VRWDVTLVYPKGSHPGVSFELSSWWPANLLWSLPSRDSGPTRIPKYLNLGGQGDDVNRCVCNFTSCSFLFPGLPFFVFVVSACVGFRVGPSAVSINMVFGSVLCFFVFPYPWGIPGMFTPGLYGRGSVVLPLLVN